LAGASGPLEAAGLGEFEQPPVIKDRQGNRIYDIPSADIEAAEFSPDRTRVAIYTGIDAHLSIWDVESGNNLRNFWPPNSILSPPVSLCGGTMESGSSQARETAKASGTRPRVISWGHSTFQGATHGTPS